MSVGVRGGVRLYGRTEGLKEGCVVLLEQDAEGLYAFTGSHSSETRTVVCGGNGVCVGEEDKITRKRIGKIWKYECFQLRVT